MRIGQQIEARVAGVKPDGKLGLSVRSRITEQMDKDAELMLARLEQGGGRHRVTDKWWPEGIRREFDMSKAAFKRAVGRLLKQGKIRMDDTEIRLP